MKGATGRTAGLPGHRGIALVLVLWVVALLTVVASAMVATGRTESAVISNRMEEARLRAAAEAAAAYSVLRLTAVDEADRWQPDGTPYDWEFAGRRLRIRVFDESSLVDLNKASGQLLGRLLEVLGSDAGQRDAIAQAIGDWRDPDAVAGAGGAEDPEYRAAGLPYGSKDGPFESVEELRQVLGMTEELYRLLVPNVTVHGSRARPRGDFAPPAVRAVLEADAGQYPAGRLSAGTGRGAQGPYYRIEVGLPEIPGRSVLLAINLKPGGGKPYALVWRRLDWRAAETQPGVAADAQVAEQ